MYFIHGLDCFLCLSNKFNIRCDNAGIVVRMPWKGNDLVNCQEPWRKMFINNRTLRVRGFADRNICSFLCQKARVFFLPPHYCSVVVPTYCKGFKYICLLCGLPNVVAVSFSFNNSRTEFSKKWNSIDKIRHNRSVRLSKLKQSRLLFHTLK